MFIFYSDFDLKRIKKEQQNIYLYRKITKNQYFPEMRNFIHAAMSRT